MREKVAILGTVPNSRILAPYQDDTWDIWCCSAGNSQQATPERVDEWFELHSIVDLNAPENKAWYGPYVQWLRVQKFPIWMQEPNDDVPGCRIFPRKALMERFGPNKTMANWFTSSPAWMFGFAIERGYKTIGVFGVDMAAAEEHYTGQKAGLQYFFQLGRELGIKVVVPHESSLAFSYPVYGYAESSRIGRHMLVRETELKNHINVLAQQRAEIERRLCHLQGSLEQVVFDRRTYVSGAHDAEIDGAENFDEFEYIPLAAGREKFDNAAPLPSALTESATNVPLAQPVIRTEPVTAADFADNPDAELLFNGNALLSESNKMVPLAERAVSERRKKTNGPIPKEGE